ncbi:TPA: hypothetical protein N0F65_005880 [Lagenidium giganteum]|uniref:Transmembrane protein n=1 Tax=Lagenidium giganteum TaxID=4803 RepID=A0AAV2YSG1_9STRA|nr:TPA: hypothetical protein N0F65_005880 [Lagenidium giganteum]
MPRRVRFRDEAASTTTAVREAASAPALHPLLQWDLYVVEWIVRVKQRVPILATFVHATTSRLRTHDISLSLWFIFVVMIPEFGFPYLWICVCNCLVVLVLQWLCDIQRPVDINPALLQPALIDPDTNGFPCVDTHMAVVVLLPAIEHTQSALAMSVFSFLMVYIGLTRIFIGARFITQVAGSWLTGYTGILIGNHGHSVVLASQLPPSFNLVAITILVFSSVAVAGFWIENNDSRVLGVPRRDYIDVMSGIMRSDAPSKIPPSATVSGPEVKASYRLRPAPVAPSGRLPRESRLVDGDSDEEDDDIVAGKKDSFYYLMVGMRERAERQRILRRQSRN